MNQDDFNMYFRGSFVTTKRGKLAYILEGDGGIVNYEVYTDNETSTRHEVEVDEVEAALNLKGFEIKPFKHESGVYSPSYTTVRGYKDGVTHSRIDFKSVNGLASRDYNELIKAMFFEEIKAVKEGVQDIFSGKKGYASLPGGFWIAKKDAVEAEEIALEEDIKLHELLLEGVDSVLKNRGVKSVAELTPSEDT